MDELAYAISLQNADALAAMGRFNGAADAVNARMNGMRSTAIGASGGMGSFAASMGRVLLLVSVVSLAIKTMAAAGNSIKLAAQFEQTNIAFKTLTGSAETAKQVIADLGSLAIDTPFTEGDLQGAAKSMLAARVPAEALKSELTAMGNIASATGGDIGRLSTVYAQVAGKGKLYAEELQQFVEQGAGELRQAVAEQLGVTTAKLNEMMAAGQVGFSTLQGAIQRLAGEGGKWGQGMADQSKTTLGLLSSLKDAVSKVMRLLAQPINDGPIKAVLTTAVDVATKTARVMEQAMAQGKVGEALKHSLILGAKLGVNATLDFIASIPTKIAATLKAISNAVEAALSGSFDAAKDLLGSFNTDTLRFDTSNQETFFKSLNEGAASASKAMQDATVWAEKLDATSTENDKKTTGKGSGDKAANMAAARNDVLGELAMLKALAGGHKAKADEIERGMRIQKDQLDIMRRTGASEEQALKLAQQKASLQDRVDGKRSKIRGVQTSDTYSDGSLSGRTGPLSSGGSLTDNGGVAGFRRMQEKNELSLGQRQPAGFRFGQRIPVVDVSLTGRRLDVGDRINNATGAPATATRDAAAAARNPNAAPGQDATLTKLDAILAELTRIRTA